jgi:hypothetical protein
MASNKSSDQDELNDSVSKADIDKIWWYDEMITTHQSNVRKREDRKLNAVSCRIQDVLHGVLCGYLKNRLE